MSLEKIVLVLLLISFLHARDLKHAALLEFRSLEAKFEQIVITQDGDEISYFGRLQAKAPNKAKWDYEMPIQKEVFVNGKELIIYESHLSEVYRHKLATTEDFFSIIARAEAISSNKLAAVLENVTYFITLSENGLPQELEYKDDLDNTIRIIFTQVKANTEILDSVFVFTPPQGKH